MSEIEINDDFLIEEWDSYVNLPELLYNVVDAILVNAEAQINDGDDALDKAVKGDTEANPPILGVKPAEEARKTALQTRDLCEAALRRRLRGLLGELAQKLDPLSPHWVTFGFRQPGAPDVPAKVKTLTGTPLGSGRTKLEWPNAARSTRFQVWGLAGEEEEMTLRARTQGELTILMENLPVAVPHKSGRCAG